MDKIPILLDGFGNTSGTSISLTICDRYGGSEAGLIHLLTSGFGVDLFWGVVDFSIDKW